MNEVLYLVDGTYNLFRAFHARGVPEMRASDGTPTKATYIFTRMLLALLEGKSPRYLGVAWDLDGPTLRHVEYDRFVAEHPELAAEMVGYKGTRDETPEDLILQMPWCKRVCTAFGIPLLELPGYEADDMLGTIARQASNAGVAVVLVTADKDLFQLVTETVTILNPHKDNLIMDPAVVEREFGVRPEQVPDVLALMGDATDNIPGVPGIGEKGAKDLIRQYGDLERLLASAGEITRKTYRESLQNHVERARLSRELARIRTDAPFDLDLKALAISPPDRAELREVFSKLQFRSLLAKYSDDVRASAAPGSGDVPAGAAGANTAIGTTGTDLAKAAIDASPRTGSTASPDASREQAQTQPRNYRAVLDEAGIASFVADAFSARAVCLDTETTSADPMRARLVGISLACRPFEAIYIPLTHSYLGVPEQPRWERVRELLRPLFEDAGVRKYAQNLKYDETVLRRAGASIRGGVFDTMIAAYVLDPGRRSYGLDALAADHIGDSKLAFSAVVGERGFEAVEVDRAAEYSCTDSDVTLRLALDLDSRLGTGDLRRLFDEIEMPLVGVLGRMEEAGVRIDVPYLSTLSIEMQHEMERISKQVFELAGHAFNLDSPVQLRRVLFEELGLTPVGRTAKTKEFSTRDEDLEALEEQHPLPARVREYRGIAKLRGTYVEALPKLVNHETGRVHTSFNQTGAASGRLSSSDPNLQNVPIRTELGRRVRRAFIPAEGSLLIKADYSQIELRILAHMAGDEALIDAFSRGEDVHRRTAAGIFGVPYDLVSDDQRRVAKTVNFGVIYGMSDFRLSRDLGISRSEAKHFISSYFERYSAVREYIDRTIEAVRREGMVRTLFGRVRHFPDAQSKNGNIRQQAERAAVNTTIQGTAADLIKKAMISLDARLTAEKLAARMLIQVHDELVLEAPVAELDTVSRAVREEMEGAHALSVPLVADLGNGENWMDTR